MMCELQIKDRRQLHPNALSIVFNFHILILVAQDVAPAKTILGSTEEAFGAFSTAAG